MSDKNYADGSLEVYQVANYIKIVDETAVLGIAGIAARRAAAEIKREAGMSWRKAREAAADAKGPHWKWWR